jgi:hypothetical protein
MDQDNVVSRIYNNFRGVDFRGAEINLVRSPDALNVWKDYKETDSIRTRPEMALHTSFTEPVYGVFFFNGITIVHSGTRLYKVTQGAATVLFDGLNPARGDGFAYENKWYFKDGKNYIAYDGNTAKAVDGYVPTTTISRSPAGGGTQYQDVNLLTGKRKNSFLADGESTEYFLDSQNIDTSFRPIVSIGGAVLEDKYSVDYTSGKITFDTAPDKPDTDGQDNVVIEFQKTIPGYRERIEKCKLLQLFDNRVFFSGNEDYPNVIWHCSLDDPSYCSDTDYYEEGMDSARIRGMVPGNNGLWVFREPSSANTTIFYHTPALDDTYGKIYPSAHSSITTGCIGSAVNFNDDIVFFSDRGVEGISGDVTTEQVISHRSTVVDRKLLAEGCYKDMILVEWQGYLLVFVGDMVYLADSRAVFTNENHPEYEWFLWRMSKNIISACVHEGILYLGTGDGVYTLTDYESDVESWWTTPIDKFKNPQKMKTTNKRGGVAEATGNEISVYVKTNSDPQWELIETYKDVKDAFVYRIKKKKFKDLQIKFYSPKRFSLESATIEVFIGGYLKNL